MRPAKQLTRTGGALCRNEVVRPRTKGSVRHRKSTGRQADWDEAQSRANVIAFQLRAITNHTHAANIGEVVGDHALKRYALRKS